MKHLPYTSVGERQTMQVLHNLGKSNKEIATILGCNASTVGRILTKFKNSGSFSPKKKSGRPKKITPNKEARIVQLCEEYRKRPASEINAMMREEDPSFKVNDTAIRYYLRKNGLHGRICCRKPLLRPANKVKRYDWARKYRHKPLAFWREVLWSDETKFELFNSKRRQVCRRKKGESLREDTIQPTVKHGGGSVMMWGCFMGGKAGDLHRVQGIMKKEQYHSILVHHAIPSGLRLGGLHFPSRQRS